METYYEILDIQEEASTSEIKSAYRSLMLKYHPDKNNSPEAVERCKKIIEAYQVLSDDSKRQAYDEELLEYRQQEQAREYFGHGSDEFNPKTHVTEEAISKEFKEISELLKKIIEEEKIKQAKGRDLLIAISGKEWQVAEKLLAETTYLNESLSRFSAINDAQREMYDKYPGFRPIHFCIIYKNEEFLLKLLELGANVNAQTEQGFSALHIAVSENDLKIVKLLIEKGAYAHYTTKKGNTPLHAAIIRGYKDVALYLVDHPSNTRNPFNKVSSNNRLNNEKMSPLILAVQKAKEKPEFWEVVKRLLNRSEIDCSRITISSIYAQSDFSVPQDIREILYHREEALKDIDAVFEKNKNKNCTIS